MQTTITWKELVNGGNQIIKLDDRRGSFPAEGDEITLNGRRYEVVGMEEAVVLLTALEPPPADPANPARKDGKALESKGVVAAREAAADDDTPLAKRNERVERRLTEEKAPAAKHVDERAAERAESTVTRTPPRAAPHQATTHHHVTSHKKK